MKIQQTTTGLTIIEPTVEVKQLCLNYFSLLNPTREFFIYKPPTKESKETIYVNSGLIGMKNNPRVDEFIKPYMKRITPRVGTDIELDVKKKPRSKMQQDCVDQMLNTDYKKLTIQIKTGAGKTLISLMALSKILKKVLIIVPTANLKDQWVKSLIDEGVDKNDITTSIDKFNDNKFCVTTISALSFRMREDPRELIRVIDNANFGVKIIDEAHLNLKSILRFDALCNIPINWYLSATLGRSSHDEDTILNRWLSDADRFIGSVEYEEYQKKFVTVYKQDCIYRPSFALCKSNFKYGKAGLIRATYYRMLMEYRSVVRKKFPFVNNVLSVTKLMRTHVNDKRKVLILVPLVDMITTIVNTMANDHYFRDLKVGGISGNVSSKEKLKIIEDYDVIISTTMSVGTGSDIQDLSIVINFDQYASPIIVEQVIGRLRDRGWECHYVDVMDRVYYAKTLVKWGEKRRMIIRYLPGVKDKMIQLPTLKG